MNQDRLRTLLAAKEDNFVERKSQAVKAADIRKTLVAFANSVPEGREAVLFIGISDQGQVQGCENTDALQKSIRQAGRDCYPSIPTVAEVLDVDGLDVVAVTIAHSKNRPHFTGPAFIRQGSESVVASRELFDEMVIARNSKVAALLLLKEMPITVYGLGHKLGEVGRVAANHCESLECRILACDAHSVTLQRLANGWTFHEAVDRIELSTDGKMKRPALVVKGM